MTGDKRITLCIINIYNAYLVFTYIVQFTPRDKSALH